MRKTIGAALGVLIVLFLGIVGIVSLRMVYLMYEQQEKRGELMGFVEQAETDLRKAELGIRLGLSGVDPEAIQDAMHRLRQAERSFDQASSLGFTKHLHDIAADGAEGVRALHKSVSNLLPLREGLYRSSAREYETALRARLAALAAIMAKTPSRIAVEQLGAIQSALLDLQSPRGRQESLEKLGLAINYLPMDLRDDEAKKIYGELQKDFIRLRDEILMQDELGGRLREGTEGFEEAIEKVYGLVSAYRTANHDLGRDMFLSEGQVRQPLQIGMLVAAVLQVLLVLLLLRRKG